MPRKSRYMPQHYIELAAITAVRVHLINQSRLYITTDKIGDSYEKVYADTRVAEKMLQAAEWSLRFLRGVFGEALNPDDCRVMQFAIYRYHPHGQKRRRRLLLRGTRFNYEAKPASVDVAKSNIEIYNRNIIAGLIPLPPKKWTLA